jgi:AraC-like DNA-binding protein
MLSQILINKNIVLSPSVSNALLIDVRKVNFQLFGILENAGFNVFETKIENYQQSVIPNLIIVDVASHGMNAITCARQQQNKCAANKELPPIIAIVDVVEVNKAEIFSLGASDYISCPLIPQEITHRLLSFRKLAKSLVPIHKHIPYLPTVCQKLASKGKVLIDNRSYHLAEKTAGYLKSHIAQEVNLEQLSRTMGTNRNKLTNSFKTYFGITPFHWLREQRLMQASLLLETTALSVLQISEQVGYLDSNNFSTAFKRVFRLSPIQYRKNQYAANKDLSVLNKG